MDIKNLSKNKKYLLIGVGVVILIGLLSNIGSCGDDNEKREVKDLTLKAAQTEIKGDLKGCYEVVDKNYKVKFAQKSYENDVVTVELKRTSNELPYDRKNVVIYSEAEKSSVEYCAGFGIEILNANGDVIDKINASATPYSWDEIKVALKLLPEETTTIGFHFDDLSDAASFRITSIVEENTKAKSAFEKEIDSFADLVDETVKIYDDADLKELKKETKAALEMAGEAFELTDKMIDILY